MGSLSSSLSPEEQGRIGAVLLTHRHFDHIRDIPSLALMTLSDPRQIELYSLKETLDGIHDHLLDGDVYPDFTKKLTDAPPKYKLHPVRPRHWFRALGYEVKPIPQPHPVPVVGYIVRSESGGCIAYTGDTGGELLPFFQDEAAPEVLFVDVTFPSHLENLAKLTGHLTPKLLKEQLQQVLKARLKLPRIVAVHISVQNRDQVVMQVESVAAELGIDLRAGEQEMIVAV
jgi:phosphoribosyl 1,2-cyclic phosphodiesterase